MSEFDDFSRRTTGTRAPFLKFSARSLSQTAMSERRAVVLTRATSGSTTQRTAWTASEGQAIDWPECADPWELRGLLRSVVHHRAPRRSETCARKASTRPSSAKIPREVLWPAPATTCLPRRRKRRRVHHSRAPRYAGLEIKLTGRPPGRRGSSRKVARARHTAKPRVSGLDLCGSFLLQFDHGFRFYELEGHQQSNA